MAWDSKNMPPFDLAGLEQNAEPGIGSVVGGGQPSGLDCSVDLKLGGFGAADRWKERQPRASGPPAAAGSPSKRARPPGNGSQVASCLVEGCKADLSKCRDYHRRHKVCEEHSKTQVVIVAGQQQRFCQQCSRFHLLEEFDEVKRSCRKRLDGHNRRRRKPQPDPMSSGSLFPSHQANRFTSFPQILSTTTAEPNWFGVVKTEEDALFTHHQPLHFMDRQQSFPISFSSNFKEARQFPFLQEDDTTLSTRTALEASVCQPLKTFSSSESSSTKMFTEGITEAPLDSNCALSLLSSPAQTATINLGQMVASNRIPMGQPLVSSLEYGRVGRYSRSQASLHGVSPTGFSCSGIEGEHVGTILVSGAGDTDLHCEGLFHVGGEGSSDGTTQPIPFSWQ